jgi:hypothetical protein
MNIPASTSKGNAETTIIERLTMSTNPQVFLHLFKKTGKPLTIDYLLKHDLVSPANLAEHITAIDQKGTVVREMSHDVVAGSGNRIEVTCKRPRTHSHGRCYSASKKVRTKQHSDLRFYIPEHKTGLLYTYHIPACETKGMKELTIPFNRDGTYRHNKYSEYLVTVERYN